MQRIITLCLILLVSTCSLLAQKIEEAAIRKHITYLASDKLEGRGAGEKGGNLAAKYIAKEFAALSLQPKGSKGFFQYFEFKESSNPHDTVGGKIKRNGKNVIAYLDNQQEKTIIIGAHYDHLGKGNHGNSLEANPVGKVHNGADDNASGVAGVLEIARVLAQNKHREQCNYLFICFSGEESGLIGSKFFTNNPTVDLSKVQCMLNMDMVGRLNDTTRSLLVYGTGTSTAFETLVNKLNPGFKIKIDSSGIGPSDHTSFYLKNMPVLHFFTGAHSDYHKPSDDADKINYPGEVAVLNYILALADTFDKLPKLPFFQTRNAEQTKSSFKVTLGIMPDYAYSNKGLRVDGVTEGRPASKAGIIAGDVIIQLGDIRTDDINLYMKALNQFKKGESTKVRFKRGDQMIEKVVTF